MFVARRHQDQLRRPAIKYALKRIPQVLELVVNGGDNNSDIGGCVLGLALPWKYGFICPMAYTVDDESQVAVDPVGVLAPRWGGRRQHHMLRIKTWKLKRTRELCEGPSRISQTRESPV